MVAGVEIYVRLHCTQGQVYSHTQLELLDAFEAQLGGEPHAIPVHQQSFLATTTWLRTGNLGTFRVRPAARDVVHKMHSRTQLVTWLIAWQQLILSPAHSALPPKLARPASQPGLFLRCCAAALTACVSFDMRSVTSQPCQTFHIHLCLAPTLLLLLIFPLVSLTCHSPAQVTLQDSQHIQLTCTRFVIPLVTKKWNPHHSNCEWICRCSV